MTPVIDGHTHPELPGATLAASSRFSGSTVLWLCVTIIWAAQMFALSTSGFSSSRTESYLVHLLAAWHIHLAPHTVDVLHTAMRKLTHVALYAVLTVLLYRTARGSWLIWRPSTAWRCVAGAALYGLSDEFHQHFVPDRGASLFDAGIDTLGAILAMALIYWRWRLVSSVGKH